MKLGTLGVIADIRIPSAGSRVITNRDESMHAYLGPALSNRLREFPRFVGGGYGFG
ncbi:MAG: hypothetical protein DHS20C16_29510 [Phycisphaerae bacterium]|nr:MAG: hypothetical protein DHS20C16_29510 [Phycisphaerae bacterium]